MFEHDVVLVTGASRGIGKAIAEHFAKAGAVVVGTATSKGGADSIAAYLQTHNNKSMGATLDICDADAVNALIDRLKESVGAPTIVVNNAAITQDNLFMRMKEAQWQDVINTNLNGVYHVIKACIRPMIKARAGRIISISSVVATMGNFGQTNYAAAKAGVIAMTKSLAAELAPYGITANVVSPGYIDTDMTRAIPDKQREQILGKIPMGRAGDVADIAHAVGFLAQPTAGYITGTTLHVNGGMHMV